MRLIQVKRVGMPGQEVDQPPAMAHDVVHPVHAADLDVRVLFLHRGSELLEAVGEDGARQRLAVRHDVAGLPGAAQFVAHLPVIDLVAHLVRPADPFGGIHGPAGAAVDGDEGRGAEALDVLVQRLHVHVAGPGLELPVVADGDRGRIGAVVDLGIAVPYARGVDAAVRPAHAVAVPEGDVGPGAARHADEVRVQRPHPTGCLRRAEGLRGEPERHVGAEQHVVVHRAQHVRGIHADGGLLSSPEGQAGKRQHSEGDGGKGEAGHGGHIRNVLFVVRQSRKATNLLRAGRILVFVVVHEKRMTPLAFHLARCVPNPRLAGTSPRRCQTLPLWLVV